MKELGFLSCCIFGVLLSCNNIPDCDDPNSLSLVIQFIDTVDMTTQPKEEIFNSIQELDQGFKFVEDTVLSLVTLEVNPSQTSTGYVFEGDGQTDTLIIGYKQNQRLRSEECGPVISLSELTILKQTFEDTLIVLNDELLTNQINIEIIR